METLKCAAVPVVTGAKASQAIWFADDARANPAIGAQRLRGGCTAAEQGLFSGLLARAHR